jgi:2-polyprenyl-3-methyl-5-hydroxy-6-metoxy-1,4-benzoquinol methylase
MIDDRYVLCPVCCSSNFVAENMLSDDRYGYPGKFALMRCCECDHAFLRQDFTPEQLTELYSKYYPRSSFDIEQHKPYKEVLGLRVWFDGLYSNPFLYVPRNVRVLDIGCGFGESLGYYEARGCEAYGVDADENIRWVADKFGYNLHVGLFKSDIYKPDFFDYVTMAQVIEHAIDPVETFKNVAKVLKPRGCLILSTPNAKGWGSRIFGKKWINWHAPYHVHLFSGKSMKLAAEKAGLVVEKNKTITSSQWLFFQWLHLATYPVMGKPSGFWSPKTLLTFKQKIIVKFVSLIHLTKINHIITRFFDSLNMGDNQVLVLRKL